MSRTQRIWGCWLLLALIGGIATAMMAQELVLRTDGNQIQFAAPGLRYLSSGRPFARLQNAESVARDSPEKDS